MSSCPTSLASAAARTPLMHRRRRRPRKPRHWRRCWTRCPA
uniref:Uncharacterized protein n=1 Tax=Arundo donax TaxID=35708 RepID=A0A0A9HL07_ARUDO